MKKLKLFFTVFTIAALLLSFVACSSPSGDGSGSDNKGDVTNNPEEDLGRELTLTFDEKIEYSSGIFYYAKDPELEDVKWYITFNNDYVVFGAKVSVMNYDFYRGSYTSDDNSITISKTHHGDPSAHGPWKEEIVKPNWKTGSFVNDTIVLKFYTSELDYNKATQQTLLSEPRLKRNAKSPEQNQNDNSNESGEVEEPIDNENEDNPEAGTGTQTDTENSKEDLTIFPKYFDGQNAATRLLKVGDVPVTEM